MTPPARLQAAIDIVDRVIAAARSEGPPADRILADAFRNARFAGSKDRRAIRELVYDAIRTCGPVPESGRAAFLRLAAQDQALAGLFDGSTYGPPPIGPEEVPAEAGIAPAWLSERLARSDITGEAAAALLLRAPLDVRVNTLKTTRDTIGLPEPGEALRAPDGLRYPGGTKVDQWPEFRDGLIEVQDCGSQLAALAVGAQPGELVIDLCAGAGGKTLALAAAMRNQGTLIAADTDRGRLSRLSPRAHRAGARISQSVLLDPHKERGSLAPWLGKADRVLIDAPCSGTGTWRRNPEARWRLTEDALTRLKALQARLLALGSSLVRPGGSLTYVTCSLLDEEGPGQMAALLDREPQWRSLVPLALPLGRAHGPGWRLTPRDDATDGFFIACIENAC